MSYLERHLLAALLVSNGHHTTRNDGSGKRGTEKVDVLYDIQHAKLHDEGAVARTS